MRPLARQATLCAWLLMPSLPAAAHGIDIVLQGDGHATIQFHYTDGTAMRGAEYRIFAPASDAFPVATGQTDASGGVPLDTTADGRWRIEVRDGQGHAGRARIDVVRGAARIASQRVPDWFVAASLVLNVLLAIALAMRPRTRSSATPAGSPIR